MTSAEEHLSDLLHAAVPEPPTGVPFDAVSRRARQRRRRTAAAGAAGVVVALVATVAVPFVLTGGTSPQHRAGPPPGNDGGRATTSGGDPTSPRVPSPPDGRTGAEPTPGSGSALPRCRATDLAFSLTWRHGEGGRLDGTLLAYNRGSEGGCDLLLKPAVAPLDAAGRPLDLKWMATDEMRFGPNVLAPGAAAKADLTWYGWCGSPVGDRVRVTLEPGNTKDIAVRGPHQPECPDDGGQYATTDWFDPLLCRAKDLQVSLTWRRAGPDTLEGTITARNRTPFVCNLAVRPGIVPLDPRGRPFGVDLPLATTADHKLTGFLAPGATARASVTWVGWCAGRVGDRVRVTWLYSQVDVVATGPHQPGCPAGGTPPHLSSGPEGSFGPLSRPSWVADASRGS